jgi:hypothetical protein
MADFLSDVKRSRIPAALGGGPSTPSAGILFSKTGETR